MLSHRNLRSKYTKKYGITDDQLNEIEEAFDIFDIDKSNKFEIAELRAALRAMGFNDLTGKQIKDILEQNDIKETCHLTKEQFIEICAEQMKKRDPLREIKRVFLLFAGKNNYIDFKALKHAAKEIGESLKDEEIQLMIDRFGTDGKVSEEQFIAIMDPAGVLRS